MLRGTRPIRRLGRLVESSAMGTMFPRKAARGKQIKSSVLVVGLLVALLAPLDLVLCRSADGHSALENAWLGCCQPGAGTLSCAPASARVLTASLPTEAGASGAPCNDIRFGTAARMSAAARPLSQPATPAWFPARPDTQGADLPRRVGPAPAHRRQVRAALSSTVLEL